MIHFHLAWCVTSFSKQQAYTSYFTAILRSSAALPRHETVRVGDHIIAVYADQKSKIDEALEFLEAGFRNGEAVMVVNDATTKELTLKRMSSEWDIDANAMEQKSDIIIKSTREWYSPDSTLDCKLVIAKWNSLASLSLLMGKKGLRVFADLSPLFACGLSKEVVDYESCFAPRFDIPLTAICAYLVADMRTLEPENVEKLEEHHLRLWA